MRKLDRYIYREMLVPLIVGTLIIAMLFMANDLIGIMKQLNIANIPKTAIAQMVLFKLPFWLGFTLPVGITMGVSLALARMQRENEVTAMRGAGISVKRILVPVAVVGLATTVVSWFNTESLMPEATKRYREIQTQVAMLGLGPEFQSNLMIKLDRYSVNFGTVIRERDGTVACQDILVIERPQPGKVWLYQSPAGTYKRGVWRFEKPTTYIFDAGRMHILQSQQPMIINEPIRVSDLFGPPVAEEMTAVQLRSAIANAKERKQDSRMLEVEYHFKYSLPYSCLVFAFAGALLSIRMARTGAFAGMLVAFGLVMMYYNIFVICKDIIGRNGWLPPVATAWLPNFMYLLLAAILLRKAE